MADYIGQYLYIRPTYIVSMPAYDSAREFNSLAFRNNQKNLKQNRHKGSLSDKSIKALKSAINWLAASAKKKSIYSKIDCRYYSFTLNLITLTLPDTTDHVSDHQFKSKLLNPFLTYMRKYYGLRNYVWKLELQSNGKLHVHITSDTFIHYTKLRAIWNRLLRSNGYLDEFKKKFGHDDPNSTDVHAVYKVKNIAAYLAKYVSKTQKPLIYSSRVRPTRHFNVYCRSLQDHRKLFINSQFNPNRIKGRIWGCNYELSKANKTTLYVDRDSCHKELRCLMNKRIKYRSITKTDTVTNLVKNVGDIFLLNKSDWEQYVDGVVRECYDTVRFNIRHIMHESLPDCIYPSEVHNESDYNSGVIEVNKEVIAKPIYKQTELYLPARIAI